MISPMPQNVCGKLTLKKRHTLFILRPYHTQQTTQAPTWEKKNTPSPQHVYLLESTPFLNTHHPNWNSLLLQKPISIPSTSLFYRNRIVFLPLFWKSELTSFIITKVSLTFWQGWASPGLGKKVRKCSRTSWWMVLGPLVASRSRSWPSLEFGGTLSIKDCFGFGGIVNTFAAIMPLNHTPHSLLQFQKPPLAEGNLPESCR